MRACVFTTPTLMTRAVPYLDGNRSHFEPAPDQARRDVEFLENGSSLPLEDKRPADLLYWLVSHRLGSKKNKRRKGL